MNRSPYTVTQNIETVRDGATIYGVYIHNLESLRSGDFAYDPPQEQMVDAYLAACLEYPQPPGTLTEAQTKLWDVPVQVTIGAFGGDRLDIYDAVRSIFARREVSRVVILADPGMGRTPGLQQMQREQAAATITAKEAAKTARAAQKEPLILPFYINLSYLLGGRDLFDLMVERFNLLTTNRLRKDGDEVADPAWIATKEQMLSLLFGSEYCCLFLLDDAEVLLSSRQTGAVQDLNRFMEDVNNQYVITCRTSSYSQQFGAAARLYLTELPIDIARRLIADKTQFEFLEKHVPGQLRSRSRLFNLLAHEKTFVLRRTVGQLVREDIRSRLRDAGEEENTQTWLGERFLEDLAFAMYVAHTISFQEREVLQVISPYIVNWHIDASSRDVLERLRAKGLLRFDSEKRSWSFGHHQVQAYFAAAAIAANTELLDQVIPEVSDYWWREVLALLTGLLSDPSQFVFDLIDHDELVAANCAEAVQGLLDANTTEAVIDGLVERMRSEGTLRRRYIVERLGNSPHPKAIQALLLTMHQQWSSKVLMAIMLAIANFMLEHPGTDIGEEEAQLLARSHRAYEPLAGVLKLCIHLIQRPKDRWKKSWVEQLIGILHDQAGPPLRRGLAAIGLGFARDAASRQQLLQLFSADDSDDLLSWCALEALSLQADEEAVKKVALLALNDTGEEARRRRSQAVFLLGHMQHDPRIIASIMAALQDTCPSVRAAAVEALAEKDLSGGRARKSIEELLPLEKDPVVLRKAAESLGRIGTYNTIPLLAQHTANPHTQTRRAVKKAILDIRERQA